MISWTVFQVIISCVYRAFELPIFFILCSKFIKIYDNTGNEVFGRRGGCHSRSSGQSVEVPFGGSDSITLVGLSFTLGMGWLRTNSIHSVRQSIRLR